MTDAAIKQRIAAAFPSMGEAAVTLLPQAGSARRYARLTLPGGDTLIATVSTNSRENAAFIYLAGRLAEAGVRVPQVTAVSPDGEAYLQSDLGDLSLYASLAPARASGSYSEADMGLLAATMRQLARVHWRASAMIDFAECYPVSEMGRREMMWDLNYFKYCYLRPLLPDLDEPGLEADFERLAGRVAHATDSQPMATFMLRDFQSRNVMVTPDGPALIDFQGGRRGPFTYDLASFIYQARAAYPAEVRRALLSSYFDEARSLCPALDEDEARRSLPDVLLLRRLQTLGTYGFRGNFERKPEFLSSAPAVVDSILADSDLTARYPAVTVALRQVAEKSAATVAGVTGQGLTVTVTSFSYRRGYPADPSGNGGGFIFDCRALHNPGRYDEYKPLTGMDRPVIEFLEKQGEVEPFIAHAEGLVDAAVDKYLSRGFTSLSVGFGCTGGRHRSVYSAERLGRHLAQRGDVRVRLVHREQGVDRVLCSPTDLKTNGI